MARLRGALGGGPDGPSWDDVEETLIAGDVGAALAMDIVEQRPAAARSRRRRGRDPRGARGLLVPRDAVTGSRARRSRAARRSSSSSA